MALFEVFLGEILNSYASVSPQIGPFHSTAFTYTSTHSICDFHPPIASTPYHYDGTATMCYIEHCGLQINLVKVQQRPRANSYSLENNIGS